MRPSERAENVSAIAAHHEAGHAVIAHMLGCRVARVSVDEDSGATLIKWSGRGEQRIERQILSNLAGPFAQRRFAPRSRWRSRSHAGFASGYVFDNVTELVCRLHDNPKVAEKYRVYMEARVEALVDQYWLHIESVARALLKDGVITGDIRTVFPPLSSVARSGARRRSRRSTQSAEAGHDHALHVRGITPFSGRTDGSATVKNKALGVAGSGVR